MASSAPTAQLTRLRAKVLSISRPDFRANVMKSLAEESRRMVVLGFQKSTSPDGKRWAPLKTRDGLPLLDTARLRNSIVARYTSQNLSIGTNVVYASTHQYGRDSIPARPFLPIGKLPVAWAMAFRKIINGAVAMKVRR